MPAARLAVVDGEGGGGWAVALTAAGSAVGGVVRFPTFLIFLAFRACLASLTSLTFPAPASFSSLIPAVTSSTLRTPHTLLTPRILRVSQRRDPRLV